MMALPVIVSSLLQLAFGSSSPPVTPESRAEHEEILRYRIRRLDVGEKNGRTLLTNSMASYPKVSPESKAALAAALDGKPYNPADLTPLVDQASSSRAIAEEALAKPYWQTTWDPVVFRSQSDLSPEYTAAILAARPIAARIATGVGGDRAGELLEDLALLLKLADTSTKCSISLEDWLVAASIHQMSNRAAIQLLSGNQLKPEAMRELAWMLEHSSLELSGIRESLRHTFAGELFTIMRMGPSLKIQEQLTGEPLGESASRHWLQLILWLTFSPEDTASFFNRLAAGIVENCDAPFEFSGLPAFAEIRAQGNPKTLWDFLQYNSRGRTLTISHLKGYESVLRSAAVHLTGREATKAAVALKRWEKDHDSQLPQSLALLIPKYLSRLPVDLVDGKPLRYNREKRLLYSIGSDMIDNVHAIPERPSLHAKDGDMILLIP